VADKQYFCDRPLKFWVIVLIASTVMLVVWVIMKQEEIMTVGEIDKTSSRADIKMAGFANDAAFSGAAQPSVLTNPHPSGNYDVVAITKATPKGGIQLIANPSYVGFQQELKDAVNAIIPSVCDIHAIWVKRSGSARRPMDAENLQFLPPFDGVIDKFIRNRGLENIGAGTLVDSRGYVLTNYHVVQDAAQIMVTVCGVQSRDYRAKIVAQDIKKDLALLKLNSRDTFTEARLGDSSFSQIGDYVIAVGSPFGMEQTVTSGIISGIRKSIRIEGLRYRDLFQTDAPINRGSSGGPLVNLKGEVIGITTAIYAPTGVYSGTGFAIPINQAKEFLSAVLGRNYSLALDRRGMFNAAIGRSKQAAGTPFSVRFGIEVLPLNSVIASQFGLDGRGGVLVNRVIPNSPASLAGVQRGDIITSIAGVPLAGISDIPRIVSHFKRGDNVNLRLLRNGKTDELLIRLW
jgi:S1-C subfamily serine protease